MTLKSLLFNDKQFNDKQSKDALLVVPGVYDGLSARQAIRAGSRAVYMSGFSVAGATYGKPDIGLLTAGEMADAAARIVDVTGATPVIADADNGYGGPLNVARVVNRYEQIGVACIQLEDQVHPKRCGHMENKRVIDRADAAMKIRVAADTRSSPSFMIMARTDARATHDLDEALARADLFLSAGADILFIEAPQSVEEMARIGETFKGVPLVINLVEDGKTPMVSHSDLLAMGYSIALLPVSALLRVAWTLGEVYHDLVSGAGSTRERTTFAEFNALVGLDAANDYVDGF